MWGIWAPVRTAWAGHLLRRRKGRERRGPGWLRSCIWLWCTGILHSHCTETESGNSQLYICGKFTTIWHSSVCDHVTSLCAVNSLRFLTLFIMLDWMKKTTSLYWMVFPAILHGYQVIQSLSLSLSNKLIKAVCTCPYFRMDLINRQICLYFIVSLPFYTLHSEEPLWRRSCDYNNYSHAV